MGMFDDLIPQAPASAPAAMSFDDLIPAPAAPDNSLTLAGATPATATAPARVVMDTSGRANRPASLLPSSVGGAARDFQVGAQGVGKGIADIVTGPFDLVAGAQNLVTGGINKVFGTSIPQATPASKLLGQGIDATGLPMIEPGEMSNSEKLAYDVNRFGTQAIGTGAMLAQRAPQLAAQTTPSTTTGGQMADALARPYVNSPGRALLGDTAGGVGAGVAVNAADKLTGEEGPFGEWNPNAKAVAEVIAPIVGSIGGNTGLAVGEGIGNMFRSVAQRLFQSAPPQIPLNPATKAPYSIPDVDRAATQVQAAATGPAPSIARNIRENADELANPVNPGEIPVGPSQMPTSGLLSQDPGLVTMEQGARTRQSPDFIQRDQNVKEGAAERVSSVRDPGADLGSVMRRAGEARAAAIEPAQQRVSQFEDIGTRVGQQRQADAAPFGAVNNEGAKATASQRLDTAVVDQNYIPARAEKNRQFDTAPGRNDQLPADDVFASIDQIRARANDLAPGTLPADFMRRLDALRPRIDADTGENMGGPGTARGGDLADLRKFVNTAQERANQSGNHDLAANLGELKKSLNDTINEAPGYAEANANYTQFADRFRPERGDEMAKFTKEIDRSGMTDGAPNRGATPPSATADRFLKSPEKAQALQRVLDGAPSAEAGNTAIRDYMRSDFATSALNADGTLNPAKVAAWSRNNADVLAQFPALRTEFDNIAATARRGEQMSADARAGIVAARNNLRDVEARTDRGAIGTLLNEDPRDVAKKLLNGGYASEARLDQIKSTIGTDAEAQRGWKAAVAEVLADKVQSTRKVGETYEVQYQRLAKEFKDNEALLAKTFTPEEMNTLRQGHKMLSYFKEAEKRATVGSQTAERINIPGWAQLVVRHFKGDLAGGGLIKRMKLLLEQLPTNKQSADEITHMAFFDPNVMAYLLERPVKAGNTALYNVNLRRLMGAANAARESGPDED